MYLYIVDHLDDIDENQPLLKSVVNQHTMLITKLRNNIKDCHLNSIKQHCLARINHAEDLELQEKIRTTTTVNDFFDLLVEYKNHCNWLNVDLVESIVIISGNDKLMKLVDKYKDTVYSKTLQQVWESIPSLSNKVKSKCSEKVKAEEHFSKRSPSDVSMKELLPYKTLSFEIAMLISEISNEVQL